MLTRCTAALLLAVGGGSFAGELPCGVLTGEAFQPVERPYSAREGERMFTAAAGNTIAVLSVPDEGEAMTLRLIRDGTVDDVHSLRLPPPVQRRDGVTVSSDDSAAMQRVFSLSLAADGETIVLQRSFDLSVYVGSALVHQVAVLFPEAVVVGNELYWCPEPVDLGDETDPPALLVRSTLDGAETEVLLRADAKRAAEEGTAVYQKLTVAPREDGKLWLVGVYSGEIMLASKSGRILGRWSLPTDGDAGGAVKGAEEALAAALVERTSDATRRPPAVSVSVATRTPLLVWAAAHGRDLVVQLSHGEEGWGPLVVLRDGDEAPRCLALPEQWADQSPFVTTDGLWMREPFGLVPWEAVEAAVHDAPALLPAARQSQDDPAATSHDAMDEVHR